MRLLIFRIFSFLGFLYLSGTNTSAQKIATLDVNLTKGASGLDIPVSLNLDEITYVSDTLLALFEVKGTSKTEIPFQVESGEIRIMHWFIDSDVSTGGKKTFELVKIKARKEKGVAALVRDGSLVFKEGRQNLLQYNFKTVYPPKGIDTSYKRSGFIHPLWSPHGQELTRIQPPDHYHHYGIWNPWTQVLYEGDTIDFWNINSRQGTVRFKNFISIVDGPVYGEFEAFHEHVVFKKNEGEKVAINELQRVRVSCPQNDPDYYIMDFIIQLNCADESPVKLLEYRYGGLGWRTTEKWDNKNSIVLTSEGKTRRDADGSKARWCIVQGEIDGDYSGVVMMSFPTNYNYPEPLRIWPENQFDRGDMFANFCPTKDMDWLLTPGHKYVLKYRFLVFNGHFNKEKADNAWFYYAYPPMVTVKIEPGNF